MEDFSKRGLGYLPDVPSANDYTATHHNVTPMLSATGLRSALVTAEASGGSTAMSAPSLAPHVDLRPYFSPVVEQGELGSCTANAGVALLGYFERRASGRSLDPSRLFLYKTTRDLLGWTGDTGAFLRSAMEALALFGVPPENYWPYDGSPEADNANFDVEPTSFCYAFARNYASLTYFRLDPSPLTPPQILDNIRTFLSKGFPSIFGFPVYPEWDKPTPDGKILFPAAGHASRGGHAIAAVGYDDSLPMGSDKGALLVRNSWGTGWGMSGYGWLSYKYVTAGLAVDWWTVIKQSWVDTGVFA